MKNSTMNFINWSGENNGNLTINLLQEISIEFVMKNECDNCLTWSFIDIENNCGQLCGALF